MIIVKDIWTEAQRVLGTCDEPTTYARLNEAVELMANLGNWDPMVGMMDICTSDCEITLPIDVEVPLAINIGGYPADFRNKWFEFHLNGPGSGCCSTGVGWNWTDKGEYPTFREMNTSSLIRAYSDLDEGADTSIRVYGFDHCDKWIMTPDCNGTLVDGFDIPVLFGIGRGMTTKQTVKRITRISKPVTRGFVYLMAMASETKGCDEDWVKLGYYLPSETEPQYRRIQVSSNRNICSALRSCSQYCSWVRMRYRRKTCVLNSQEDVIFLHSTTALKMALMAVRKYEDDLIDQYKAYKAEAKVSLNEEQKTRSGPNQIMIQMQRSGWMSRTGENMI